MMLAFAAHFNDPTTMGSTSAYPNLIPQADGFEEAGGLEPYLFEERCLAEDDACCTRSCLESGWCCFPL